MFVDQVGTKQKKQGVFLRGDEQHKLRVRAREKRASEGKRRKDGRNRGNISQQRNKKKGGSKG